MTGGRILPALRGGGRLFGCARMHRSIAAHPLPRRRPCRLMLSSRMRPVWSPGLKTQHLTMRSAPVALPGRLARVIQEVIRNLKGHSEPVPIFGQCSFLFGAGPAQYCSASAASFHEYCCLFSKDLEIGFFGYS